MHDVDLEVPAGDLTLLVGPSGCGKTTLISLIAGLLDPTAGEIVVLGSELTRLSTNEKSLFRRSHLGFVFQQYQLFLHSRPSKMRRCR